MSSAPADTNPGPVIARYEVLETCRAGNPIVRVTFREKAIILEPERGPALVFHLEYWEGDFYKTIVKIDNYLYEQTERQAPDMPFEVSTYYPGGRYYRGSPSGRVAYLYVAALPRATPTTSVQSFQIPRALLLWFSDDTPRRLRVFDGLTVYLHPRLEQPGSR